MDSSDRIVRVGRDARGTPDRHQAAEEQITPPQDVELGLKAAAEVRQQYPIIKDERISAHLTKLGDRLVGAAGSAISQGTLAAVLLPDACA